MIEFAGETNAAIMMLGLQGLRGELDAVVSRNGISGIVARRDGLEVYAIKIGEDKPEYLSMLVSDGTEAEMAAAKEWFYSIIDVSSYTKENDGHLAA